MNPLFKLSNLELESSLRNLVQKERQILHVILEHIKEVARRGLHLQKHYSGMREYLMGEFGYSDSAARRRMEAAVLMMEVPALAEKISDGSIHLSQIGELSRAIKEKELTETVRVSAEVKNELVAMISGKSTRETQQDLAQALDIKLKDFEFQRVQKDESVRIEITISKELNEKLQQCRDLASQKIQQERMGQSLASVIEVLADLYLKMKLSGTKKGVLQIDEPKVEELRKDNSKIKQAKGEASEIEKSKVGLTMIKQVRVNRTITPLTRRLILQRDQCCQYQDPKTGKKCGSSRNPQVDHKTSRWAGGTNEYENLQQLCARHNRIKYRSEVQLNLE